MSVVAAGGAVAGAVVKTGLWSKIVLLAGKAWSVIKSIYLCQSQNLS